MSEQHRLTRRWCQEDESRLVAEPRRVWRWLAVKEIW